MRILLDSTAYSQLGRGHPAVADIVRRSQEVVLSAVVVGELLYGYRHGAQTARNIRELDSFLANPYVTFAPVSRITADRYARIAAAQRAKGQPLPTNDMWIAAHAMETGTELVTSDGHFEHIDGLACVHVPVE
ncbi:MAG: type II toxin-antitoxin system VapC family toxin [Spirochaetaceae bacterium]|nr:type II toxin-antitoxin system VapC family toxin [Spirochaetaceae bacterium]